MKPAPSSVPGTASPEPMMEVNMTPLIDVMLVLIIMLIITIPRQNDVAELTMPTASNSPAQPDFVTLAVEADGTIVWDGVVVKNRQDLEERLNTIVLTGNVTSLQLRPDRGADYKHVASVLSSAQRLRVRHLGIVGNEQLI